MRHAQSSATDAHSAAKRSPYRRVVVKVGTSVLTNGTNRLNLEAMASIVGQTARLRDAGIEVCVVSSGAIAAGRHAIGVRSHSERRSRGESASGAVSRQVLASVGQSRLMQAWDQLFGWHEILTAQTLLTRGDVADRLRYLNARTTLLALLEHEIVPIVNENDAVAVDEIRETRIGDNDNLSALVANLVDADLLVMLTDIDGLYTADPRKDSNATLIPVVHRLDERIEALAGGAGTGQGTGGMVTKLQAARIATSSGIDVIIANGRLPDALLRIVRGEPIGTLFKAITSLVENRKRWMFAAASDRGAIVVDDGAAQAVLHQGRSLLPAGVIEVEGSFVRGDVVPLLGPGRRRIALGISNYDAADLARIRRARSDRIEAILGFSHGNEVIHRDNLIVVTAEPPATAEAEPQLEPTGGQR